jgi:hypothetical protein
MTLVDILFSPLVGGGVFSIYPYEVLRFISPIFILIPDLLYINRLIIPYLLVYQRSLHCPIRTEIPAKLNRTSPMLSSPRRINLFYSSALCQDPRVDLCRPEEV